METSFKQILVPVDGSAQSMMAFKSAVFFARKFDSALVVLHIDEDDIGQEDIKNKLVQEAEGFTYVYQHRKGTVYREIVNATKEIDANLIVMGTHGVSGFQEFWMGSNAYKVVSSVQCPVITMREKGRSNEFKKIVVPIDTSFESRQKVPVAIRLAKQFDSTLHLLGVSVGNDKEAEHKVNAYIRQSKHTIEEAGIKYVMEKRLGGNVTDLTIDYAKSIDADLILCMTEQEPQLGSFFLGKFAQQMVNHSTVPVMSLMPREDLMLGEAVL